MKQLLAGLGLLGASTMLKRKNTGLGYSDSYEDEMLRQYLIAALWSSTDSHGTPYDKNWDVSEISKESKEQARKDVKSFINTAGKLLNEVDAQGAGHDFWLTRNHHGAGFWDGDYPEDVGRRLTALSHTFREIYIVEGDEEAILYLE